MTPESCKSIQKYSREELLKLQQSHHELSNIEKCHIDSILHPQKSCSGRGIRARITRRPSDYSDVITGKQSKNLVILLTYASIIHPLIKITISCSSNHNSNKSATRQPAIPVKQPRLLMKTNKSHLVCF